MTVSGYLTLPGDMPTSLPSGSCFNAYVQEAIFCLYCENPVLGRTNVNNPRIENGKIAYEITMKNVKRGRFLVHATLNVGWCGAGDEWIRYNDLHNVFLHEFSLNKTQTHVSQNVAVVRYQSKSGSKYRIIMFLKIEVGIIFVFVVTKVLNVTSHFLLNVGQKDALI